VYLPTSSITASKCICKLTQSQPPSTSLLSHDYFVVKWQCYMSKRPSATLYCTCPNIRREFVKKSISGSRKLGHWWKYMMGYLAGINNTHWIDLYTLRYSVWNQELGMIKCVSPIERCLYTPVYPQYLLPIVQSISIVPKFQYAPLPPPCHSAHLS